MAVLALVLVGLGSLSTGLPLDKKDVTLSTGISMKYLDFGNPEGEPVILLHGITDSSRSFLPMMERLTAQRPDLRLLALDQRGHGDSSLPAEARCRSTPEDCFRPDDFAADVVAFLDALGVDRAHIVGHSMGSTAAQRVAHNRPERVLTLVLIGGFASGRDNPPLRDFLLADRAEGAWRKSLESKGRRFPDEVYELTPLDADPDAEAWMLENWVYDPSADPEFLSAVARETARTPLGTWIGAARALLSFDDREALVNLTVPTLVLWATQDSFFPRAPYQTDILAALDGAVAACRTRYVFKEYGTRPLPPSGIQEDDLGHNLQWGAPRAVALDLASWLREEGQPTGDHYAADPRNPLRVLTTKGAAMRIEGRPAARCQASFD